MKRFMIGVAWALTALAMASCRSKEPATQCIYGDNIPPEQLDAIMVTANHLMQLLEAGDYAKLHEAGTEELMASQGRDQFALVLDSFVKAFGSLEYPMVQEAYLMESKSKEERVWISCNLGQPGVEDLWGMPTNQKLAAVIFRARTDMEGLRVVFQLHWQYEQWRLRSISLHPMTIKRRTYEYYFKQALEYREQNLLHLAVLYYKTSILLSDIGLNVDEFTVRAITDQISQIKVDYLPGGEVQIWSVPSGNSYKVYKLDTAYDNGNLLVQINYMTSTIADKDQLEKEARELALFLDEKYPEYRIGFDGFRVTAASEMPEEALKAYHIVLLFADLPAPKPADNAKDKTAPPDVPNK